jgi:quinoprotein glucose dehydrogenase
MRLFSRSLTVLLSVGVALAVAPPSARAQQGAKNGEWPTYGGDLGNTRYSALDQINADNFNKLEIAWRFKTDSLGPRPEFNLESTPLMVNGRLFSTGGTRRAVVALDAATGEMLPRRVSCPVAGSRTGPTVARNGSSMSRPDIA